MIAHHNKIIIKEKVMKKAVISGIRQAGLVDVPDPKPVEDWAFVKVTVVPMCTEYKNFTHGIPSNYLGHEAVGEVVELAQPGKVKVGDRVVVMPQYPCGTCDLCIAGDYIYCEQLVDFDHFYRQPGRESDLCPVSAETILAAAEYPGGYIG